MNGAVLSLGRLRVKFEAASSLWEHRAMIDFGVAAEIVAAAATAAAAGFAGYQIWELRRDRRQARQLETDGVSLAWRNLEAPSQAQVEPRVWKIEFLLTNPGAMPISDVRCEVHFGDPVRRHCYDRSIELPTKTIVLRADVLPGGGTRAWNRRLEPAPGGAPPDRCWATVSFVGADGVAHRNVWPISHRGEGVTV